MTVVIKQKVTVIPIEFEGLDGNTKHKFEFNATDEVISNFDDFIKESNNELKKIDKNSEKLSEEQQAAETIKLIKNAIDKTCGVGAFDELYAESPSQIIMVGYFYSIIEGLKEEISNLGLNSSQKKQAEKYLKLKNKNKK